MWWEKWMSFFEKDWADVFLFSVFAAEPSFRVPPDNVTVIEGQTAILPCSILHLTEENKVRTFL